MAATQLQPAGWRDVLRWAVSEGVPARSLKVALVVGVVLNLINQGDALAAGAPLAWGKIALTFCVPYFVSTYGAVSYRWSAARRAATARRASS